MSSGALPARREHDHTAWVTIQVGCDNSCTFCIVPIVRGPEVSRRMGDIVREVEELAADGVREITLLGQNVNSYGRDLGAGQYRPQFADLLRRARRGRRHRTHPLHVAAPQGPAARDHRGDGRVRVGVRAPAPAVAVGQRPHPVAHAPRLHRTALPRAARRGRAAIPDLAVTTDIIVGFPGETDADFERTLAVADEAAYDAAYTFVFSPRPGTPAAEMGDDFVAPEVAQDRMTRLLEVVEGHTLVKHEARVGRTEVVLLEGPSKKDATVWSGRTRQGKLVHFVPGRCARRGRRRGRRARHVRGAALPPRRPARGASGSPSLAHPHPCGRCAGLIEHLALVGPTASGKSSLALRYASAHDDVEIVSMDSMQVYRGMDVGTAKATPEEREQVPHHLIDVCDPDEEWSVVRFQAEARAAVADIEARGGARCWWVVPGCTCRR